MPELSNILKDDFLSNPPRWSGYTTAQTPLLIPSIDPSLNGSWVSPDSNVIPEDDLSHLFDYTTKPGSVTYIGTDPIILVCTSSISMTSNINNVKARFKWVKNGTPESEPDRFVSRKIGTGTDEGAISAERRFTAETGDYFDFYFGCDTAPVTLNIEKAEWGIVAISKIFNP